MLIDLQTDRIPDDIRYDLCIVGAGAAGISIAKEFIHSDFKIAFIESGGFELESDTQRLYKGKSEGNITQSDQYLSSSRLRYFGGTTNIWTGSCRPLDEIDFKKRDWISNSGWPIDKGEIDPYYRKAEKLVEINPFDKLDNNQFIWGESDKTSYGIRAPYFQWSPPTRFGNKYRQEILSADSIDLYINSNLTNIKFNENKDIASKIIIDSINNKSAEVYFKYIVLSCGGIETPRIMLNCREDFPNGIGNNNNLVGKYFMEHPHSASGILMKWDLRRLRRFSKWQEFNKSELNGVPSMRFLSPSEETQRKEKLLNIAVGAWGSYGLDHEFTEVENNRNTVNFVKLTESLSMPQNFLKQAFQSLLRIRAEQTPRESNCIKLTDEKDKLGMQKIHLICNYSNFELENYRKSLMLLNRALSLQYDGRIRLDLNNGSNIFGGSHHMGTTRMSSNTMAGVVNENCRVHNIENLFIAGSSVFSTSGCANPTLTLIALSLRLADHIKKLNNDNGR